MEIRTITNGHKILSMKMEHLLFLDNVTNIPCALRKLPDAFGLEATESC